MNRPRKLDKQLPPYVYRRRGAYWHVRIVDGRQQWTKLGKELPASLQAYGRRIERTAGGMPKLLEDALPAILTDKRGKRVKASSEAEYRSAVRKLQGIFAEFDPQQVRTADVYGMMDGLRDTPVMANFCLAVLRKAFVWAVRRELVETNPTNGVAYFPRNERDRYLTDGEFQAIADNAPPLLQCIMDACYLTGQRISDVLSIKLAALGDNGIGFEQRKTGARLLVQWTPELLDVAGRAKALQGDVRGFFLFSRRGQRLSYRTVLDWWGKACAAAGVQDARIHDIRAKALTDAKRQGVDPVALAGHASAAMTARYIRLREVPTVTGPRGIKR